MYPNKVLGLVSSSARLSDMTGPFTKAIFGMSHFTQLTQTSPVLTAAELGTRRGDAAFVHSGRFLLFKLTL